MRHEKRPRQTHSCGHANDDSASAAAARGASRIRPCEHGSAVAYVQNIVLFRLHINFKTRTIYYKINSNRKC